MGLNPATPIIAYCASPSGPAGYVVPARQRFHSDELVLSRVVQLLYVQARMAAQVDTSADRTLLSAALDDMMALVLGVEG